MADSRVIAEWLRQDQLEGSRRSITLGPDRAAVVISDGRYGEPHSEERVETRGRFGNIGRAKEIEVLSADLTPFSISYELDDTSGAAPNPGVIRFTTPVLSSDDHLITGRIQLTLAVSAERPGLLRQIRRGRSQITDLDIGEALAEIFLSQVIGTNISTTDSADVRPTADQFSRLQQTTETQLRSQLENYGLELRNFAANLLPLQAMTRAEKEQIDRRRQKAEADRDIGRIEGRRPVELNVPSGPDRRSPAAGAPSPVAPPTKIGGGGGGKRWLIGLGIAAAVAVIALVAVVASGGSGGSDESTIVQPPSSDGSSVPVVAAPTATPRPTSIPPSATSVPAVAAPTPTPRPTSVPPTATTVPAVAAPAPTPHPTPTPTSTPVPNATPGATLTPTASVLELSWQSGDGTPVNKLPGGTEVTLLARFFGVPNTQLQVEIFEVDPDSPDDLVAVVLMEVTDGIGTAVWNTVWMPDGPLGVGGDPEYKFVVLSAESGELVVVPLPNPLLPRLAGLPPGTIVSMAGTGERGFSGDGGPASDAQLSTPLGLSIDRQGNVLIADTNNSRVRKIDAATGIITTIAGTGPDSGKIDGFPAAQALVRSPIGVAVDADNNLYIAQSQRIRSVDSSTGIISTLIENLTRQPNGVATDCQGNVYVAMGNGAYILRVNPSTGATAIVAGLPGDGGLSDDGTLATAAKLNFPTDVVVDCEGNLFIADAGNQRVFKVDATSRILVTVAGGAGNAGFSGDGGPATSATLFSPSGVAVDGQGNLFIADTNNDRIRRVDAATGVITTVAGTGIYGFSGDDGPATLAQLAHPQRIAMDGVGNLYISDTDNYKIRVVTGVAVQAG